MSILALGCGEPEETEGTTDPMSDTAEPEDDGELDAGEEDGESSGGDTWGGESVSVSSFCADRDDALNTTCAEQCGNGYCLGATRGVAECHPDGVDEPDIDHRCDVAVGSMHLECTCAYPDDVGGDTARSQCFGHPGEGFDMWAPDSWDGSCEDWCESEGLGACMWSEWYRSDEDCGTDGPERVDSSGEKPAKHFYDPPGTEEPGSPSAYRFACEL